MNETTIKNKQEFYCFLPVPPRNCLAHSLGCLKIIPRLQIYNIPWLGTLIWSHPLPCLVTTTLSSDPASSKEPLLYQGTPHLSFTARGLLMII